MREKCYFKTHISRKQSVPTSLFFKYETTFITRSLNFKIINKNPQRKPFYKAEYQCYYKGIADVYTFASV